MAASANVIDFAKAKANATKTRATMFYNQPYSPSMNLVGWALFLGAVIVISIMWRMILAHILDGISD